VPPCAKDGESPGCRPAWPLIELALCERNLTKARGSKAIQVDTTMIQNEATWRVFRPDLEHPTESDFAAAS
jgi:hypothetical protein